MLSLIIHYNDDIRASLHINHSNTLRDTVMIRAPSLHLKGS